MADKSENVQIEISLCVILLFNVVERDVFCVSSFILYFSLHEGIRR